ncbi:MAG: hypothetical protein ACJ8EH_09170 [Sphingomicrobium sp.]
MTRFHLLLACAFVTSGCAALPHQTMVTSSASILTPMQLIATIGAHKGETVTVAGYFTSVVDTRALWETESAHRNAEQLRKGSWDKCITIYPTSGLARQFNGHRVHITGNATIIGKDDFRSSWTCNPVALENAVITPG